MGSGRGGCCGRGGGRLPLPGFWPRIGVRFYVTNECQPPEYDLGAVHVAASICNNISSERPQDQRADGAAVETPAGAAIERAGAKAGRGGRRAGRRARRLASWARMGEAARAAGACAGEGRAGGGAESGSRVCPSGWGGVAPVGVGRGCGVGWGCRGGE